MIASIIAASLITTAAGILVAIPATCFYNYLCTRIDLPESETGNISRKVSARGNFPLAKAFSALPTFAVIAAPALAISLLGFMVLPPTHSPMGLHVRLLKIGSLDAERPPLVKPTMVRILDSAGRPNVYVDSRPTRQDELNNALQASLNRNRTVDVAADGNVLWADVANAIGVIVGLGGDVVLLTAAPPNSDSGHNWR
jgi:biopolymer transport protein ExbD